MSNPFDKLQQIFKAELKDVKFLNNLKIFSNNKTTNVTNNVLVVNPKNLPPEIQKQVQEIIKETFEGREELLEEGSNQRIADYTAKIASADNQNIIEFFRGRLEQDDVILLQSCLYLRTVFQNGGDYALLKSQIVNRYHARGANVSNLCTARYFETHIIPMFQELERWEKLSDEAFQKIYDDMVVNYPFAVFINQWMGTEEIEEAITKKIEANKKNGIFYLTVHGIGEKNVDAILKTLAEIEKDSKITRKTIDQSGQVIALRIEFESDPLL